ncbi:hypothetical protein [Streptomyces sp. NPDC003480]
MEWDGPEDQRIRSVVSYSASAAEDRMTVLEDEGHTDVTVVAVPIFGGKN